MLDLEPIKARLEAATAGPWCCESDWPMVYSLAPGQQGKFVASGLAGAQTKANRLPVAPPNMVFIAAAPTDLAALVAEVLRLRHVILAADELLTHDLIDEAHEKLSAITDEIADSAPATP